MAWLGCGSPRDMTKADVAWRGYGSPRDMARVEVAWFGWAAMVCDNVIMC